MAVCRKCGKKIEKSFCTNCGTSSNTNYKTQNTLLLRMLSYVGILWIIGLFSKYKNDLNLRFHVGQGIVLTIYSLIINLIRLVINNVIIFNLFKEEQYILNHKTDVYILNDAGEKISNFILILCVASILIYMVIGIKNAARNKNKGLPFIGKYSFYQ